MHQVRKDVLNGWKEIAAYLGRDPRTVERWEKTRSLPVRRLPGSGRATVYALVPELDAWLAHPAGHREPLTSLESAEPVVPSVAEAALQDAPSQQQNATTAQSLPTPRSRWYWVPAGLGTVLILLLLAAGTRAARSSRKDVSSAPPLLHGTTSPIPGLEALYLRGSYQMELRTPDSLRLAQSIFGEALRSDPHYAPALAGLGSTYVLAREYAMMRDEEAYPKAKAAALQAIALQPDLAQAHAVLGFVDFFWMWDSSAAEHEFQTALRLEPGLPLAHHWYGSMLTHQYRLDEALRELNTAQRLAPNSSAILTTRALALGLSGRRKDSCDLLDEVISAEGTGHYRNPATMHQVMGTLSLLAPRDLKRFLVENLLAAQLREDTLAVEAMQTALQVYRRDGELAAWKNLLTNENLRHPGAPTYAKVRYEAQLGDHEASLDLLATLYRNHDPALIGIAVDPALAPLAREPRFTRIRSAMGLQDSQEK